MISNNSNNNLAFGGFYHTVLNSRKGIAHSFPRKPTVSCLGADLFILIASTRLIKKHPEEIKVYKAGTGLEEKIIFDISGKAYNSLIFKQGIFPFILKILLPKKVRKHLNLKPSSENPKKMFDEFGYFFPNKKIKGFHFEMPKAHMDALNKSLNNVGEKQNSFIQKKIVFFLHGLFKKNLAKSVSKALGEDKNWQEEFFTRSQDIEKSIQIHQQDTDHLSVPIL